MLFFLLFFLICTSAFFSASETGLISLNRHRLRHLVLQEVPGALQAETLLRQKDVLLSVILLGNNFVNILASALATWIGIGLFGDIGVGIASALLTIIILICAEIAPKTYAANHPEKVALMASFVLIPILRIFRPLVYLFNALSKQIVRLLGTPHSKLANQEVSLEELRLILDDAQCSKTINQPQHQMLNAVLDLDQMRMGEIMIRKKNIEGIDINLSWEEIKDSVEHTFYTRLPIWKEDVNQLIGVLHVRKFMTYSFTEEAQKKELLDLLEAPFYVPESASILKQLIFMQKQKQQLSFVIDEYGNIKGVVSLFDLLEEIYGTPTPTEHDYIPYQPGDESVLVSGQVSVRAINRRLDWDLPTEEANTISGLVMSQLEHMPQANMSLKLFSKRIDVVLVRNHVIEKLRLHVDGAD